MSNKRTKKKPIITEIALHCLLRWLAGGSYLDIRLSAGILVPSFYQIVHKCIAAILCCNELSYFFPTKREEISQTIKEFIALELLMDMLDALMVYC